jgi:hypothetical protein
MSVLTPLRTAILPSGMQVKWTLGGVLADDRVDPAADINFAFTFASASGHLAVVKLLLADKRVDPTAHEHYAIRYASKNWRIKVVKLLSDERVDPAMNTNMAIRYASREGHMHVVSLMLADECVDSPGQKNGAIRWASRRERVDIVERLLADQRVDPVAKSNYAIRHASQNRHLKIEKLLLGDERVDLARMPTTLFDMQAAWGTKTWFVPCFNILPLLSQSMHCLWQMPPVKQEVLRFCCRGNRRSCPSCAVLRCHVFSVDRSSRN